MKVGYSSPCVCLTAEEGKKNRLSLEIPPCLASSHSVITTTQNNGYFHEKSSKCISSAIWPQGHCITLNWPSFGEAAVVASLQEL